MARVRFRWKKSHQGKRKEGLEHGSWWARYTGANGKREEVRLPTARTEREAKELARQLEERAWRLKQGLPAAPVGPITFAEAAQAYEKSMVGTSQEDAVRYDLGRHLVPHFGRQVLAEITPGDVEDWTRAQLAAGFAPGTVKLRRQRIAGVYRWAQQHRRFDGVAPTKLARPMKVPRRLPVVIPPDELHAILRHAGRWRLLLEFAALTGARKGELYGLRWEDLQLDTPGAARWHKRHTYEREATKGRHEDVLPLPEGLAHTLRAARTLSTGPLVFPTEFGKVRSQHGPAKFFVLIQRRAGLPGTYTLKHLRSTFAASVGSMDAAQELLGHTDARVTREHYRAARAERWRADVERVAEVLLPGKPEPKG